MTTPETLVALAKQARSRSYCPYSGFAVGAALLCADGIVYQGCNIENAAYGPSICAERVAVFRAVAEGKRDFAALAVAGGKAGEEITALCPPCGVCRQVLAEFCPPEFPVLLITGEDSFTRLPLGELLPMGFGPSYLKKHKDNPQSE